MKRPLLLLLAALAPPVFGGTPQAAADGPLPDALLASDGTRVNSAGQWEKVRRPELLEVFASEIYGRVPEAARKAAPRFSVVESGPVFNGAAERRVVRATVDGPGGGLSFDFQLFLPRGVRPKLCFLHIVIGANGREVLARAANQPHERWPVDKIVARGFATAAFDSWDLALDDKAKAFSSGVFPVFGPFAAPGGERPADAWGAIAAWAWGASRVADYLAGADGMRGVPLAVIGHSRGGKTALWCGACDTRFALVISNNSGSTGAALARGKTGESVRKINTSFPYWFAGNYKKYNDAEDKLPVDQHELLGLVAPRRVYVASATADAWADPRNEFRACEAASAVFRLHGLGGVGEGQVAAGGWRHDGAIGFHLREGKHSITVWDWERYMDYAERWFGQ
ncbi:MAG: alpha/beta hydrolase [Opitutaceae bacterium]|jgi:hypothetical protein|nr:alpha/beta hydrolase [Opitutaceae bacterium]